MSSFERSVGGSRSSESSGSFSDDGSGSLSSFERSTSSSHRRTSHSGRRGYYYDCWYCRYHYPCLFHYHHGTYDYDGAPPSYTHRGAGTNLVHELAYERVPGDPLLPMLRFDFGWHSVESDVQAFDYGLEIGYSALAVRGRTITYREEDPGDSLDLSSVLVLYRIPLSRDVEFDAGLGGAELDGADSQGGLDFSLALRGWVPDRRMGFEYRGEFMDIGEGMSSHDISVLLHLRWFALRAGYRWLHSNGDSLDGPFAGAALSF